MQSKVQTQDVVTRHDFKANLAEKVAQSTVPTVTQGAPIVEPVQVTVPVNFHTMSKYHLFGYLTHAGLTLEQANDVIDLLDNKASGTSGTQFNITLQGVHALQELEAECILPEVRTVEVELPYNFNSLRVQDRFLWLMKESHLGLSAQEVNDVIDIVEGKSQLTQTQFTLTYADAPPALQEMQRFSHSVTEETPRKLLTHFDVPEFPEGFELKTRVEQYRVLTDELKKTPEHARFILDTLQLQTTPEVAEAEVAPAQIIYVSLPFAFRSWQERDQFAFLTKVKHLSTQDTEDVIAHWNGQQQLSTVLLDWEDVVDSEGRTAFKHKMAQRLKKLKAVGPGKIQKFDMPELPEGFSLLTGMDQYRVLTVDLSLTPEHAYLVLRSLEKQPQPTAKAESIALRQEIISISIPHSFKEWNSANRFSYLTKNKHLSSYDANDVIAFCNGAETQAEINLTWEDIVDPEGRTALKGRLAKEVQAASVQHILPEEFLLDPKAERFEIISVPEIFSTLSELDKYVYLTRNLALEHETAVEVLGGNPRYSISTDFASPVSKDDSVSLLKPAVKPIPATKKEAAHAKISVSLPPSFNSLRPGDQYWYLVKTKEMSYAEANDLQAVLANKPTSGAYEFVIDWEE